MLDQSVVVSKITGGGPVRLTLNAATPDVVVDGGSGGASVAVISGAALTAVIGNDYAPTGAWAGVAAGASQAVAAGVRRAFKQGGPDHVPIVITHT